MRLSCPDHLLQLNKSRDGSAAQGASRVNSHDAGEAGGAECDVPAWDEDHVARPFHAYHTLLLCLLRLHNA